MDTFNYVPTQTSEQRVETRHRGGDEKTELHGHATTPYPGVSTREHRLSSTPSGISELDDSGNEF